MNDDPLPSTIEWVDGHVRLIDQRRLPGELAFLDVATVEQLCEAIETLAVRGAPALGVAGAMGVALAATRGEPLAEAAARIVATRPTAVNLAWGSSRPLLPTTRWPRVGASLPRTSSATAGSASAVCC